MTQSKKFSWHQPIWVVSLFLPTLARLHKLEEVTDGIGTECVPDSPPEGRSLLQRKFASEIVPSMVGPQKDELGIKRCFETVQFGSGPSGQVNATLLVTQEKIKAMLQACIRNSGKLGQVSRYNIDSTEIVEPELEWSPINSQKACEMNDERIERRMDSGSPNDNAEYTLDECKAKCRATARCAAIDYFSASKWCNLFDTPCTTPQLNSYGASSYELTGYPCETGSGSSCKACQPESQRGAPNHCALCNDGYFLANKTCMAHDVTCTSGTVWIIVNDKPKPPPAHVADNIPKGICLQTLVRNGGHTFWEGRTRSIVSYLNTQPEITFVIMTDTDVWVNALTLQLIQQRFNALATPTARVVVGMEQTCWLGYPCSPEEANAWLRTVRGNLSSRYKDLNLFPNSQFMGEVDAVKAMLRRGLEVDSGNDQAAIGKMIKENASLFALDSNETVFVSMSRGAKSNSRGNWTCNSGGDDSHWCDITDVQWGSCDYTDGFITLTGGNILSHGVHLNPLVIHMNGLAPWCLGNGKDCTEIFQRVSGGELA